MTLTDATPSPSEAVLAALLAEFDRAPEGKRSAVVDHFLRQYPAHGDAIRDVIEVHAGVRPPSAPAAAPAGPRLRDGGRLGPFRVVRFLAHGGQGEVYEAVQDVLDRRVALKVIRNGFVSPTAEARFRREQQVLAALHQTNIVPVFHAGTEGDLQYCAMQYVDGASLHRVVTELRSRETSTGLNGHTPPIREVVGLLMQPAKENPSLSAVVTGPQAPALPAVAPPRTLSPAYFDSVAAVMIQVADAVQHGHDRQVCHRDIKPSNLIIDASETCWVIDYGLAGAVNGAVIGHADPGATDDKLTLGPVGTPRYMAPEQFDGKTDARSDVWGLGVTLYELLTLRPAFRADGWEATKALVAGTEPADPRALVENVPADLAAICRKAMAKDPADRYPTAQAFADDLRRWRGWEPTAARPGWATLRPARLWAWRHKAWAVTAAVVFLGLAAGLVAAQARTDHANERAGRANERAAHEAELAKLATERAELAAAEAEDRKRQLDYQRGFAEAEDIRHATPYIRWSSELLSKLNELRAINTARGIQYDPAIRDRVAAALTGPDARVIRAYPLPAPKDTVIGLSGVAFGPNGRVLTGGYLQERTSKVDLSPALLFDGNLAHEPTASSQPGSGPVAFADAETPVQLLLPVGDRWNLLLWNVGTNREVTTISLPDGLRRAETVVAALSPDARLAVASVTRPPGEDGKRSGATFLWAVDPTKPGAPPKKLATWDEPASALAFAPDGKYLAAGTRDGFVSVRRAADGAEALRFEDGWARVSALAFGRNFRKGTDRPRLAEGGLPGRLLAVGTESGTTTVWDLETRARATVFREVEHYVNALAFSPDGETLVTAGFNAPIAWDVASGRAAFKFPLGGYQTGVAFSPDGRRLAVTTTSTLGGEGHLRVVEIEADRPVRTYRGLAGSVSCTWVSPSKKWVASLSHNWQLGLWERATGRLAFVWNVPAGWTSDNADVAFDEPGDTLIFASGERATRLNLTTGEQTGSWSFPTGLNDNLVIRTGVRPILLRREWDEPFEQAKPRPKATIRSRELLDDGTVRERYSLPAVTRVNHAFLYAGGKYLLISSGSPDSRGIYLHDGDTGKEIPLPQLPAGEHPTGGFVTENGRLLSLVAKDQNGFLTHVFRLPDMTLHGTYRFQDYGSVDDSGKLAFTRAGHDGRTPCALYQVGETRPLVLFDIGLPLGSNVKRGLTPDGSYCFWSRPDGTVCVADINRCLKELTLFLNR